MVGGGLEATQGDWTCNGCISSPWMWNETNLGSPGGGIRLIYFLCHNWIMQSTHAVPTQKVSIWRNQWIFVLNLKTNIKPKTSLPLGTHFSPATTEVFTIARPWAPEHSYILRTRQPIPLKFQFLKKIGPHAIVVQDGLIIKKSYVPLYKKKYSSAWLAFTPSFYGWTSYGEHLSL